MRLLTDALADFNERVAVWTVTNVATMTCAYVFAVIALIALPQAYSESFTAHGFSPLPLVTWLSQSLLQLVLLSVIMVGQNIQSRVAEKRSNEQYSAVMEMLNDMRAEHEERREILEDCRMLVQGLVDRKK